MIRPFDINKSGKKASFRCDEHHGIVKNLNLLTKAKRINNKMNLPVDSESEDLIVIKGTELTPPCNCFCSFPTWTPINELGYELGKAKTKDD